MGNSMEKMRFVISRIPWWAWAIIAFLMVYFTQKVFVNLHPEVCGYEYWNFKWMREPENGYTNLIFLGHDYRDWFWIDTFLYLLSTFITAFISSFLISIGLKNDRKTGTVAILTNTAALFPFTLTILHPGDYPPPALCRAHRVIDSPESLVVWMVFSFLMGIFLFFFVKILWKRRKKKKTTKIGESEGAP